MTKAEFHNLLRVLRSIDGWELPDLPPDLVSSFIADPYRFFITCDEATSEAIWRVALARHRASHQEFVIEEHYGYKP